MFLDRRMSKLRLSAKNNELKKTTKSTDGFAYYADIHKLEFYVLGTEENRKDAHVFISNKELFKSDIPVEGGCYDPSMGTTDYNWTCATCFNEKGKCPGHFGALELRYPVKSPLFRDDILKWLKIVCFRCGHLLVTKNLNSVPPSKRMRKYVELSKGITRCTNEECAEPHPKVSKDKQKQCRFLIERKDTSDAKMSIDRQDELYNHLIRDILGRIPDEAITAVGKPLVCHPRNYILDVIRIPPNTIRPDIRRIGGNRSSNSDCTALVKNIVEINEMLPNEPPSVEEINEKLSELYFNLDLAYYEMVRGSSTANNQIRLVSPGQKGVMSIALRIPGKPGRIRKNLMGKRANHMARSVISGDETLSIDEIGIPLKLASALQIPEVVRPYNIDRLKIYFANKRNIYPGCSSIFIHATQKMHKVEPLANMNYELQYGDIVYRDLIEGDYVAFNRQPSLLFGQIGAHKVVIMEKASTIRINVSACSPYNADFDGDAANLIIAQNIQSRVELQELSWIGTWTVSYQNNSPYFGCFQDSLIGSAEITRSDIKMDKWHAMRLFSNVKAETLGARTDGFNFDKPFYTGREIISKILPRINYPRKKTSSFLPQYLGSISYDPDETHVQINRGELISGTLDKATVGQQVMGSIFHIINNEYGAKTALETIYNFHQVTCQFFFWYGFTVGIKDINISEKAIQTVRSRTKAMIANAKKITDSLNKRELITPLGIKLAHFYEKEQLTALEAGDDFVVPILEDIDFKENKLARLIFTGSRGKKSNFININGSFGQITIGGRRPPRNAGWGRTSPYFLRYDTEPRSLGFIETSYREGIAPDVFPFCAGDARFSSINNALSTSISGAQSRISIKNLESVIINNLRQSVKDKNIIQMLYAETGVDTRRTEAVKFISALISDKKMEEDYHAQVKMFPQYIGMKSGDIQKELDLEYKQLLRDREVFREIFIWAENNNPGQYIIDHTLQMPVNPFRIIEDVLYNYEETLNSESVPKEAKLLDPVRTIKKVRDLCDNLPYMYFNTQYENKKARIPEVHKTAVTLLCILIRTYLCTANLARKKITNYHLDIIIEKIRITFKNSLVEYGAAVGILAAQCLSEPLTQYVLDSKHRSGGGGGTSINVVERFKEILGAKPGKKIKVPSMIIMVKSEYEKNKVKVQEIANHIEMMNFERFVLSERIFYESYGTPVHPQFTNEQKMIQQFEKNNAGMRIPGNLTKWCIRYEINKEELLINNMKLDTIITKLRIKYPDLHLVYTPESVETIIIRAYLPQSMVKIPASGFTENIILDVLRDINKTVIRGIKGITYTKVTPIVKSEVKEDGSIETGQVFGITTLGSNLEDIMDNDYVDKYRTQTNDIEEFERTFGIEATRQKIITEIRKTMSSGNVIREHTAIFADEMTYSGKTTAIQKTGLQVREFSNATLRMSFQSPIEAIKGAAINNITDVIRGVSGHLINGQIPRIGTTYNNVLIDEEMVRTYFNKNEKNIDDEL